MEALDAAGIGTGKSLLATMNSKKYSRALQSFAASKRVSTDDVSPLARTLLMIAISRPKVLREHFPEMIQDADIERIASEHEGK